MDTSWAHLRTSIMPSAESDADPSPTAHTWAYSAGRAARPAWGLPGLVLVLTSPPQSAPSATDDTVKVRLRT
jgi:hypothetical protein